MYIYIIHNPLYLEEMISMTEKHYHIRTKYEPQLYNDWEIADISDKEEALYIVSKLKDELLYPDKGILAPHIYKTKVVPVVIEMINDGDFTVECIYDFICYYWSSIENGRDLGILADYLEQCHWYEKDIKTTLKRRLKKQADNKGYITIYRGFSDHNREEGNSYTLSLDKAIWFSRRFAKEVSYVKKYKIHISHVLAFITNRNEAEIVADPYDVILLETIETKKDSGAKIS